MQERYIYDPYGSVTYLTPSWTTQSSSSYAWIYLHQGGRLDATTGLYLFRNRDYSPTLGRWMELDPLGFGGGDTNLYRYAGNAGPSAIDPSGLENMQFRHYDDAGMTELIVAPSPPERTWADDLAEWIGPERISGPIGPLERRAPDIANGVGLVAIGLAEEGFGGVLLVTPEPVATKIIGGIAVVNGIDNIGRGVDLITGGNGESPIKKGVSAGLQGVGVGPGTANAIGQGAKDTAEGVSIIGGMYYGVGELGADDAIMPRSLAGEGEGAASGASGRGGPYGHLKDHPTVNSGKPFTQSQKARILQENEAGNGGILLDDRTGEELVRPQKYSKGVSPPSNEAQVDHVYPRSKGGPNSFGNAEVRSRLNNLRKSDTLPGGD